MSKSKKWNLSVDTLGEMGLIDERSKLYPDRFYCLTSEDYVNLYYFDDYKSVMQGVYERGEKAGFAAGKVKRSEEFRRLLNCDDD